MAAFLKRGTDPIPDRLGVVAIVRDQVTLDRIRDVVRELQLDDELSFAATLDVTLRRIHEGQRPRVLVIDVSNSSAPMADISAARVVGGADLKLVALGSLNDVGLFRSLMAAGASDYLVMPPNREALSLLLEKPRLKSGGAGGLGRVIVFIGSRGGVGTTAAAISCAWVLAEERTERTALIDLDLNFGTIALQLDIDPTHGLCEALEQPSRIDSLFVQGVMIRVTDNLRTLAAEASIATPQHVDPGAIDMLFYELRRQFAWTLVDLPRVVTPTQRVVLATASHVVVLCERSLAGLRDTMRLQAIVREQAPQSQLLLIETGAHVSIGKRQFEKAAGVSFSGSLSYDPRAADAAVNAGKPLPLGAPHSAYARDVQQLIIKIAGAAEPLKRRPWSPHAMLARFRQVIGWPDIDDSGGGDLPVAPAFEPATNTQTETQPWR
jgi:pilus assembly protein CpaE